VWVPTTLTFMRLLQKALPCLRLQVRNTEWIVFTLSATYFERFREEHSRKLYKYAPLYQFSL
jgi:hypothetical protein